MNNNNILNRFFSKNTFFDLIKNGNNDSYFEIIRRYSIDRNGENQEIISSIYSILKKTYKNEYFYKNTLLNTLIIKKHKVRTTKVLTELPICKSIADFILLNGKSIVYEIKTELDNLDKLETQINDYYSCFPNVCIVTCEKHLPKVLVKYKDTSVGIYYFSKRNALKIVQDCQANYTKLSHKAMFKLLRKYEFENIILDNGFSVPKTTQFDYYAACFVLFQKINLVKLTSDILDILKARCNIQIEKFERVPEELKLLIYQSKLNNDQYDRLDRFLNTKYYAGGEIDVFSIFER